MYNTLKEGLYSTMTKCFDKFADKPNETFINCQSQPNKNVKLCGSSLYEKKPGFPTRECLNQNALKSQNIMLL